MPTSQFTIYSSGDAGAPVLTGTSGSLVLLLDACLVTGYGSKTAAGWSKPIANSGSVYYTAGSGSVMGCWKQGSGSMLTLFVNDAGLNANSTYREAFANGWESITAMSASVGNGNGQFPLPSQLLTTGHVVVRKSASTDTTVRGWIMFADAATFYLYILNGDTATCYTSFYFGDIFSLKGASDLYDCMISGKTTENSNASTDTYSFIYDATGATSMTLATDGAYSTTKTPVLSNQTGMYLARTSGGGGGSALAVRLWDVSKTVFNIHSTYSLLVMLLNGSMQSPNSADNSLYIDPIQVVETSSGGVRGRMRGMYHVCHPASNFADGQTFSGAGDYAGKTFQIVKSFISPNYAFCAIEISNTVETN